MCVMISMLPRPYQAKRVKGRMCVMLSMLPRPYQARRVKGRMCVMIYVCYEICVLWYMCVMRYVCYEIFVLWYMCVMIYVCLRYVCYDICVLWVMIYVCYEICVLWYMCVMIYVCYDIIYVCYDMCVMRYVCYDICVLWYMCVMISMLPLFLRFFYWILKLFRHGIFLFSFYNSHLQETKWQWEPCLIQFTILDVNRQNCIQHFMDHSLQLAVIREHQLHFVVVQAFAKDSKYNYRFSCPF
jgi:hypothetical protein